MPDIYRIHGDNIVECERITKLILNEICPTQCHVGMISPSVLAYAIKFNYCGYAFSWELHLLPGFNKSGRHRWEGNIFDALKDNGSFLDETPDAIVTSVDSNGTETILFAVEFCSALQAGNQAWQRSGRAFSTGRTGCPYLYIVDFVKYELDPRTRKRKNLRFPNPAVPYSYINFSKTNGSFVAQVYVRAEEFDLREPALKNFNEDDFAQVELSRYIVKLMCGLDVKAEEDAILRKNFNVVLFLSQNANPNSNFTETAWKRLSAYGGGIIQFSLENKTFDFHKTITEKGQHGKSAKFREIVSNNSVGLTSKNLPFGIIPASARQKFADDLHNLYPAFDINVIDRIGSGSSDMILCIIKGFKPRGDDNRPDRGILPLAAMLTSTDIEIMTYIYGPIYANNFNLLLRDPRKLAESNGLWKSVLALSNYVALDTPVLSDPPTDKELLIDTSNLKREYTSCAAYRNNLTMPCFSCRPKEFHEDDVDTGIHFIFAHILKRNCFEGMCNPPGGDWSGLSVIVDGREERWPSLPRVSEDVDGKRPDHVLELFEIFEKPLLLSIESKEQSKDLEEDVGTGLINYVQHLMKYPPSAERDLCSHSMWLRPDSLVNPMDFEFMSAAAYLKGGAQSAETVFAKSHCDLLIVMDPTQSGWDVELIPRTTTAQTLKNFIIAEISTSGFDNIRIL